MGNLTINTLHKFQKLPFESEFFYDTYRLMGRSGKEGAIDQLLQIFPNCIAGINAIDADEDVAYLELYLMFYRLYQGKIRKYESVPAYISFVERKDVSRSKDPFTFFSDKTSLELYSLTNVMPDSLQVEDLRFLDEQRIVFTEQLEKIQTIPVNADELFLGKGLKNSDYFNINTSIDDTGLLKVYQNLGHIQN